ncbi:MAG: cold shock domain-containing protein [bacterium]|nr:cold shock domain-containing protein [bacterium]
MTGTIKKIVEGKPFGFIAVEGREKDLFFHESSTGGAFAQLKEGDTVTFDEDLSGPKGPAAVNVQKAS